MSQQRKLEDIVRTCAFQRIQDTEKDVWAIKEWGADRLKFEVKGIPSTQAALRREDPAEIHGMREKDL